MWPMLLFLMIGTVLMGVPVIAVGRRYDFAVWKCGLSTVLLTVFGTVGTYLMYWVENGEFGGTSFYGAVFLVPLLFLPVAFVLRVPYGRLLDLCALGECVMLAWMRVHCLINGCCSGRLLFTISDIEIRFPSQIVEMLIAVAIAYVLWRWVVEKPHRCGRLYGWYLVLYGTTRFVVNFMRAEWQSPQRVPLGTIWSLVAAFLGVVWLLLAARSAKKESEF